MKPTKQTILHDPEHGKHGNCLSAVIASLLHISIKEVPLFIDPETWVQDLNRWLRPYGIAYCIIDNFDACIGAFGIEGVWHEATGHTKRSNDILHACVAKDGKVVFDPHPDDSGLTDRMSYGVFIILEPWRVSDL